MYSENWKVPIIFSYLKSMGLFMLLQHCIKQKMPEYFETMVTRQFSTYIKNLKQFQSTTRKY